MKKNFKIAASLIAVAMITAGMSSCSSSDDTTAAYNKYADKSFGEAAIDAGTVLSQYLTQGNAAAASDEQDATKKAEMDVILKGVVNNVIIKTYTQLGDACDEMKTALGNLQTSNIQQSNIDAACTAFKKARRLWEMSESFLGGAASDKDIDPHIDSWPLNRVDLHTLLLAKQNGTEPTNLDESVLGFHALEFIFFRDGQNRTVAALQNMDTYKGFTDIKGSTELAYAETVLDDLVKHVYALQCSWEGQTTDNASRYATAQSISSSLTDGLTTSKGQSYGWNMLNYGNANSTFSTQAEVVEQLLSLSEGSCKGICSEVSDKKIARPFNKADVSYVESPFSYNSISDFSDNIRSINNIWYGGIEATAGTNSTCMYEYFKKYHTVSCTNISNAIANTISKIEAMPYPFVKYCETINGQKYEDSELKEYDD